MGRLQRCNFKFDAPFIIDELFPVTVDKVLKL